MNGHYDACGNMMHREYDVWAIWCTGNIMDVQYGTWAIWCVGSIIHGKYDVCQCHFLLCHILLWRQNYVYSTFD